MLYRSDIDQALSKIDEMAGTQEDLIAEEAMILRGWAMLHKSFLLDILDIINSPQTDNSEMYKEALNRLNAKIAFNPDDLDLTKTVNTQLQIFTDFDTLFIGSSCWNGSQEAYSTLYNYCCWGLLWCHFQGTRLAFYEFSFISSFEFITSCFLSSQPPPTINASFASCSSRHSVDLDGSSEGLCRYAR